MAEYCYIYAIVRREAPIPSHLAGLTNAPLTTVACQELAAVVSATESTAPTTTPDALLHHEAVVEALWDSGPTLPARFGTILADPAAVEEALAERYQTLLADLQRLGDKVELGLTILWGAGTAPCEEPEQSRLPTLAEAAASGRTGPGRRYLETRMTRYRHDAVQQSQAHSVIAQLDEALEAHPLERRYRVLAGPRLAVRAAYLMERGQVPVMQRVVDQMRTLQPDLRWLLSGPWPPYAFVTETKAPFSEVVGPKCESGDVQGGKL